MSETSEKVGGRKYWPKAFHRSDNCGFSFSPLFDLCDRNYVGDQVKDDWLLVEFQELKKNLSSCLTEKINKIVKSTRDY